MSFTISLERIEYLISDNVYEIYHKQKFHYIARFCFYLKYLRQRDRQSVLYRPHLLQEVSVNQLLQFVPRLCLQHHWTVYLSKVTALAGTRVAQLRRSGMLRYACLSDCPSACPAVRLFVSRSVCLFLYCALSVGEWINFSATHLLGQYVDHSGVCTCLVSVCHFVSSGTIKI